MTPRSGFVGSTPSYLTTSGYEEEAMSKRRIIDCLRQMYPDLTWTYDPQRAVWQGSRGWHVYACSVLYDGDDTFRTEYRRSDMPLSKLDMSITPRVPMTSEQQQAYDEIKRLQDRLDAVLASQSDFRDENKRLARDCDEAERERDALRKEVEQLRRNHERLNALLEREGDTILNLNRMLNFLLEGVLGPYVSAFHIPECRGIVASPRAQAIFQAAERMGACDKKKEEG
jgi:FtsZ-binding cell division protein ZapB